MVGGGSVLPFCFLDISPHQAFPWLASEKAARRDAAWRTGNGKALWGPHKDEKGRGRF